MRLIAEAGLRGADAEAANARAEAKTRRAWGLCVGPALQSHTIFLRLVQGRIVVGAWDLAMIPSLRSAAEATWPQVKDRLERLTKLRLIGLEVVPTDPPKRKVPPSTQPVDAFAEVLHRLRKKAP